MARPPKYATEEDKPVSATFRIPRNLYDQAQQHASRRQTTLTELVCEGLQMRLDTPTDPRDILATQDITVMQELRQMIADEVQAALAVQHFQVPEPAPAQQGEDNSTTQHYSNSTPVQAHEPEPGHSLVTEPAPTRRGGRPRSPEGEQLRGSLTPSKPLGDTLSGMRRTGVVRTQGAGRALRYFVAR